MRLDAVKAENCSRVADFQLKIRGHAVIVGGNEVGKTSLLRALHLLLGSSTAQLYQELTASDFRRQDAPLVVEATFKALNEAEWTLFPHETTVNLQDPETTLTIRLEAAIDDADGETLTIRRSFPDSGHDRQPTREQLAAFGWRYLPANRTASQSQLEGKNSATQTLLTGIDLEKEKKTLLELLEGFNSTLAASPAVVDLKREIAKALSRATPKAVAETDIALRNSADPNELDLQNVALYLSRGGSFASLLEQSDGLKQLLMMTLFDLAAETAHVIAIDEPELHLHPAAQRTAAELFLSSANQKILVTHSPYVVHKFDPSQVVAMRPDGRARQIPEQNAKKIERIRANWWSPRLLEALTARHVLVVEGLADRLIVEGVARALSIGLDRLGIVVLDIGGADNFPHVFKLLGPDGFDIPVFGVVDQAEQGVFTNAYGGKLHTVLNEKVWVSAPDLEGEYCQGVGNSRITELLVAAKVCKEKDILQSCGVTSVSDIDPLKLAAYCRSGKVPAADAIGRGLTESDANAISSVCLPLKKIVAGLV